MPEPIRNPQRVINALWACIARYPDERVAQIMMNAAIFYRPAGTHVEEGNPDIFYVEDNAMAEALEKYTAR